MKALDILSREPDIDLVIMDIMMPEMDGYETIRRIREQKKFSNLPVIALTAKAMKKDYEQCIAVGANDYMSKPVDTTRLISMLRIWLYR
jgi:CheY-like chemotaxis protein